MKRVFLCLALFSAISCCMAQDASDVELKPYGSYASGGIDTVDLATGNLFLHIPLLSYPQRGKLPPLTFSIELNNAPYNQTGVIVDPDIPGDSYFLSTRYDISPPGTAYHAPVSTPSIFSTSNGNFGTVGSWYSTIGAYISSSYEGGIAMGRVAANPCSGCSYGGMLQLSAVDPGGRTHEIDPDLTSYLASHDLFKATDGSGFSFTPAGPCNAWDIISCGMSFDYSILTPSPPGPGLRLGTLVGPDGIQYSDVATTYVVNGSDTAKLLTTTVKDPAGNFVTRGPWYWSGYYSPNSSGVMQSFYAVPANKPQFIDSVGRHIDDVISLQQSLPEPRVSGAPPIVWQVPGVNGPEPYTITFVSLLSDGGQLASDNSADPALLARAEGWAIQSVTLPNGTQWRFEYGQDLVNGSPFDLTTVHTPTGGSISYTYTMIGLGGAQFSPLTICNAYCHAVKTRTESDGTNSWTTTYSYSTLSGFSNCPIATATTERDDLGNETVHTFCSLGSQNTGAVANAFREIQTDYYQGPSQNSSGRTPVLLKTVKTQYEWNSNLYQQGITNVLPIQVSTTFHASPDTISTTISSNTKYSNDFNAPLFKAVTVSCGTDSAGNEACSQVKTLNVNYIEPVSEATTSSSEGLLRTATTEYQWMNDGRYGTKNLLNLPYTKIVQDAFNVQFAKTTYAYDEQGSPQGIYGNQTSVTRWLNTGGQNETSTAYNSQGMPVTTTDGVGNAGDSPAQHSTQITYDATGVFPQEIDHPSTNGISHIDTYTYDAAFGKVLSHTDENNNTTRYQYDDLARVTDVKYPSTQGGVGESVMCYSDESSCGQTNVLPNSVYITTIATPSPNVVTIHSYDGLGRKIADILQSDPLGAITTQTTYDEYGRVVATTNPYRAMPAPGDPPRGSMQTVYDALGRVVEQVQPDSTVSQPKIIWSCYENRGETFGQPNCSQNMTTYDFSDWVDTTDELGRHTQRITDSLGRLGSVIEPDPASNALTFLTQYTYDALNNLTYVNQSTASGPNAGGRRLRSFSYDSLSRLLTSDNPETGTICYGQWSAAVCIGGYDANGNLLLKTDGRGLTIYYSPSESPIDALNRVTKKTYSNGEPAVNYIYDGLTVVNGKGRLAREYTGPISAPITQRTILAYDAMGRVTSETRCIIPSSCLVPGNNYAMNFTYDAAGRLLAYPSGYGGISFSQSYDASGRLQTLNGSQPTQQDSLFSSPQYTPAGALSGVKLGAGLNLSRTYDVRQRVLSETDSSVQSGAASIPAPSVITINGIEQAK